MCKNVCAKSVMSSSSSSSSSSGRGGDQRTRDVEGVASHSLFSGGDLEAARGAVRDGVSRLPEYRQNLDVEAGTLATFVVSGDIG